MWSEVDDELVVFDPQTNQAHALNATSALIFGLCDGSTTAAEMAPRLEELGLPPDPEIVALALSELSDAGLVTVTGEEAAPGVTRRGLARRLGLSAAALALIPAIESIDVQPAMASTSPALTTTFTTTQVGTTTFTTTQVGTTTFTTTKGVPFTTTGVPFTTTPTSS